MKDVVITETLTHKLQQHIFQEDIYAAQEPAKLKNNTIESTLHMKGMPLVAHIVKCSLFLLVSKKETEFEEAM